MKAKDLISIFQSNPEAEIIVSTVQYYEKNHYEAGYKRDCYQQAESFTVDLGRNEIQIEGGRERTV